MGYCVDALLWLGGVRRATGEHHLHHGVAAQRPGEREPGRLAHHGHIGAHTEARECGDHRFGADAEVLLVGDECEDDAPRQLGACELLGSSDHRGDPALHVAGAAAQQTVTLDTGGEGLAHPVGAHGVEVAREHDGGPALARGGMRRDRKEARPVGVAVGNDDLGGETGGVEAGSQVLHDLRLPRRPRDETRVDRVDGDELDGQRGRRVPDGVICRLLVTHAVDDSARLRCANGRGGNRFGMRLRALERCG